MDYLAKKHVDSRDVREMADPVMSSSLLGRGVEARADGGSTMRHVMIPGKDSAGMCESVQVWTAALGTVVAAFANSSRASVVSAVIGANVGVRNGPNFP